MNYRLLPIFVFVLILLTLNVSAQNGPKPIDKLTLGFGFGLDHGGLGGNITLYPQRNIGIFAGGGYAFAGFGYNFGLKIRVISDNPNAKISPFVVGMYGYNAAIAVLNQKSLNKLFNGPTFGLGIDTRIRHNKNHYWSFAVLVPVRSPDVDVYIDDLKNNHGIDFQNNLIPIAFTIGYRLVLN